MRWPRKIIVWRSASSQDRWYPMARGDKPNEAEAVYQLVTPVHKRRAKKGRRTR